MTTPTLGLSGTTQAAGSAVKFLDWRLAQDNTTNSNMTKIDLFATNISASVTTLFSGISYLVNAIELTTNNYVATVTGFIDYTDGKLINLILDVTQTGTTTLNINSLGTKSLYKISSNGIAGNISSGDLVAGRANFFMYNLAGGYWLWVNATSADQINIEGNINEIPVLSGSGLVSSGISASSLGLVDNYYLVTQLGSQLTNEKVLTAGSGIGLIANPSASSLRIANNILGGTNISLSVNTSSSAVTINSGTAASSIAPSTASYILFGSLDSVLTNEKVLTAGSGTSIASTASSVSVNVVATSPIVASGSAVSHANSGVTAGSYTSPTLIIDASGHVTSASNASPPRCRVYRTTDFNTTTTLSTVTFEGEDYDTDSMWTSASATRITMTTAGFYLVTADVRWANGTAGNYRRVGIHVDGDTSLVVANIVTPAAADETPLMSLAGVYLFSAGQYVQLHLRAGETINTLYANMTAIKLF